MSVVPLAVVPTTVLSTNMPSEASTAPLLFSDGLGAETPAADDRVLPLELTINTHIPSRQQLSEVSPIEHEVVFEGNANGMIVVY